VYAMGLKHLKAGVEKKFAIALRSLASAKNGRIGDFGVSGAQILDRRTNAIDRKLVGGRVVYDATLADLFPARFKLWLDQNYRLNADSLQRVPSSPSYTRVAEIKDTSMDTKLIPEPRSPGLR
jgi:hypothetical protein